MQHQSVHHEENKEHECNICQKEFKYKHTYDAHMRLHSDEKPF